MAIKLLKQEIHNIASLVYADIDYEKNIVDFGTGAPSSLFLIFGDTGSGKTAILDALTLALYKTTTRINNVANKKNNSYRDNDGNEVNIFDIRQYTRIGISSKDKCFTKVEFIDRNGCKCIAQLELGFTSTGNYKKPSWSYQIDGNTYTTDADINAVIAKSIGLDFSQFQHTSILAQGKCDSFLIGGKEERKLIMAQLTDTEKFTKIGEGITSVSKKYKDEKNNAETTAQSYKNLLLSPEKLSNLRDEELNLDKEIKSLEKNIREDEDKKSVTDRLLNANVDKKAANDKKEELETKQNEPQHKADVKLVSDWDNSINARKDLDTYDKAIAEISSSKQKLTQRETIFKELNEDLLYKQESLENIKKSSCEVETWLTDNNAKEGVYENEGAITTKMEEYQRHERNIVEKEKNLDVEKKKTESLKKGLEEATEKWSGEKEQEEKIKENVDELNRKKDELRPAEITAELTDANNHKNSLDELKNDVDEQANIDNGIETKTSSLNKLKGEIDDLNTQEMAAEKVYQKAKEEADGVNRVYNDVQLSKGEVLQKMREQLAADHADICPLCGSHVEDWGVNLDIVLEPLKKQKEEKDKAVKEADRIHKDIIRKKGEKVGEQNRLTDELKELKRQLAEINNEIASRASTLELDSTSDLLPQINNRIAEINNQIEQLNRRSRNVQILDGQIRTTNNQLTEAQNASNTAKENVNSAQNALDKNTDDIKRLGDEIANEKAGLNSLKTDINTLLAGYYGMWNNNTAKTIDQLKADKQAYDKKKTEYEKIQNQIKTLAETIRRIDATKNQILEKYPSWDNLLESIEASQSSYSDVESEWGKLNNSVSSNIDNIVKNTTIKNQSFESLKDYYSKSGNDESALRNIVGNTTTISEKRTQINELKNGISLQNTLIQKAEDTIRDCYLKLNIGDISMMEPLSTIEQRIKNNTELKNTKLESLGKVKEQLRVYKENDILYKAAEKDYQNKKRIFEKWERLNNKFGGNKLCLLVQSYIMKPLLKNANTFLERITDRYCLTFNNENEQLSILVIDKYNKNQIRSATILSGGERFMISLALSLSLSALNNSDSNFNILFIDEGFGTLDNESLDSVMRTLEMLPYITGQADRRVGIISHIEELVERIQTQIHVIKKGEGRSITKIKNN